MKLIITQIIHICSTEKSDFIVFFTDFWCTDKSKNQKGIQGNKYALRVTL